MREKCEVINSRVQLCEHFESMIEYGRKTGFALRETINIELHKIDISYVVYKNGDRKKGLLVNYCPICGADISRHIHDEATND